MRLSVVLCTLGRPERLAPLVAAVCDQLPDDAELVVIDQSDGDAARDGRAAVAGHPQARWIAHQPPGLPGARNRGIRDSHGDVVWFIDDDVHLLPGCIAAHLEAYADPTVGGVGGRIIERALRPNAAEVCNRVGRDGRIRTRLDGAESQDIDSLKGANMSFRRRALVQAGPFDERLGGTALLEDADLSERVRRQGWRLRYVPDAAVIHDHDPMGGVRQSCASATVVSRFANTGYFVGRYRPMHDLPLVLTTHVALAARHRWGDGVAVRPLLRALVRGWWRGRRADAPHW